MHMQQHLQDDDFWRMVGLLISGMGVEKVGL